MLTQYVRVCESCMWGKWRVCHFLVCLIMFVVHERTHNDHMLSTSSAESFSENKYLYLLGSTGRALVAMFVSISLEYSGLSNRQVDSYTETRVFLVWLNFRQCQRSFVNMTTSGRANNNYFAKIITMAWHKTAVTPLLKHWGYCSLALSHRYAPCSV